MDRIKAAGALWLAISYLLLWEVESGEIQGVLCPQEYSLLFGDELKEVNAWESTADSPSLFIFAFRPNMNGYREIQRKWRVSERAVKTEPTK